MGGRLGRSSGSSFWSTFGLGEINPVVNSILTMGVIFILISVGSAPNVRRRVREWIEADANNLGKLPLIPGVADEADGPGIASILPGDDREPVAIGSAGSRPRKRIFKFSHSSRNTVAGSRDVNVGPVQPGEMDAVLSSRSSGPLQYARDMLQHLRRKSSDWLPSVKRAAFALTLGRSESKPVIIDATPATSSSATALTIESSI
eukprot:2369949-Prymnesium_polylepis.1